jgi:membrane protease YdiL (CAAX protease family)
MAATKKPVTAVAVIPTRNHRTSVMHALRSLKPLFQNFWLFILIIVVLLGTQISLFEKPIVGVYVNAVAFAALVGVGLWREQVRQLAISAAILPVSLMITLSLPQTSTFAQAVVFYDAILLIGLVYRFMFTLDEPLANTRLNLRGYLTALPLMIVIGQAAGVLGYGLLRHQYTFGTTALPLVAATSVVFAISEEVLFRGLIQQRAAKVLHPVVAAALSAILYALFTFGHAGSYLAPLFGLIMGIILSTTYYKKQNLILTIAINAGSKLTYIGLMAAFVFR